MIVREGHLIRKRILMSSAACLIKNVVAGTINRLMINSQTRLKSLRRILKKKRSVLICLMGRVHLKMKISSKHSKGKHSSHLIVLTEVSIRELAKLTQKVTISQQ